MKEISNNNLSFESIKHIDENGGEFWYARELMIVLSINNGDALKTLYLKQCVLVKTAVLLYLIILPTLAK